ncbi:ATP-binding protein [Pyrodictium occultum]|nr:ATP-binding protein [Pyrodictium occultum]
MRLRLPRRARVRRELRLADVWLMERWPVETLDASKMTDPPFADIGGAGSVLESLVDQAVSGRGGIYVVVGGPGSGKTTLLKTLHSRLRRGGVYSVYVNASGRSLDDLVAGLCTILGCTEPSLDSLREKLRERAAEKGAMALLVDDIDRMAGGNIDDVIKLLTTLTSAQRELGRSLLIVFSMARDTLARLSLDPLTRGLIKSYMEVIDMDEHLVKSPSDLARLIYAHFQRVRPRSLSKKAAATLSRYPLHPIRDQSVINVLYDVIGDDTPRVYLEKLDELLRIAASSRSRLVSVSHANVLARRILQARRGAIPLTQIRAVILRRYVNGLLAGGLVVLGTMAVTLSMINLVPPGLKLPYIVVGLVLMLVGVLVHMKSVSAP